MSLDFRRTLQRRFRSLLERDSESELDGSAETSRIGLFGPTGNLEHVRAGCHHQHPAVGRRSAAGFERNRKVRRSKVHLKS